MKKTILLLLFISLLSSTGFSQRVKDVAYFRGANAEQLVGYGLVVGLSGTGDSYRFNATIQMVTSMMKRFGITTPDDRLLRTRNAAAVMVTADVSNLLKNGGRFDVTVSSIGDAKSLLGGELVTTPLSWVRDGRVYAMAAGQVSIGGYDFETASGGRIAKNHATSGNIPSGGMLEQQLVTGQFNNTQVSVMLKNPDFSTANNVATAINQQFNDALAIPLDAGEIQVNVPVDRQANVTSFMAELETIQVETSTVAKVVLNERTGTVVAGEHVNIQPVTISYGSLKIAIKSNPIISQPGPFSGGQTTVFNNLVPTVETADSTHVVALEGASNVQEVAAALNSLKVSPRDIIAIFQAIKESGALPAELVIM